VNVTDAVIRTEALSKRYGKTLALSGLDVEVQRGEVFGFLGPNGAGKTTTIRLLLDALRPTSGTASVLGLDPWRQRVELHRRIGFVPSELGAWKRQHAGAWLSWLASVRAVDAGERIAELAERFKLDLTRTIGELSLGNRRKVGLVQAFMHEPELVILDEPTNGLDPLMQLEFRKLLVEWRAAGRTVFLSSHAMDEVQHVADRVAIVRQGELAAISSVSDLLAGASVTYRVRFARAPEPDAFAGVANVREATAERDDITFTLEGPPDALIKALASYDVVSLVTQSVDLEDVFVRYYGDGAGSERSP